MSWLFDLFKDTGNLITAAIGFLVAAALFIVVMKRKDAAAERTERKLSEYEAQVKEMAHIKENFQHEVEVARANALSESSELRSRLAEESQHRQALEEALLNHERTQQDRAMGLAHEEPTPIALKVETNEPKSGPMTRAEVEAVVHAMTTPTPALDVVSTTTPAPMVVTHQVETISQEAHAELKSQIDRLSAEIAQMGKALRNPEQEKLRESHEAIAKSADRLQQGMESHSATVARLSNQLAEATRAYNEAVAAMQKDVHGHLSDVTTHAVIDKEVMPVDARPVDAPRVESAPVITFERSAGM